MLTFIKRRWLNVCDECMDAHMSFYFKQNTKGKIMKKEMSVYARWLMLKH